MCPPAAVDNRLASGVEGRMCPAESGASRLVPLMRERALAGGADVRPDWAPAALRIRSEATDRDV